MKLGMMTEKEEWSFVTFASFAVMQFCIFLLFQGERTYVVFVVMQLCTAFFIAGVIKLIFLCTEYRSPFILYSVRVIDMVTTWIWRAVFLFAFAIIAIGLATSQPVFEWISQAMRASAGR